MKARQRTGTPQDGRSLLTGASYSRIATIASGRETVTETAFDADTGVLTSVSQVGGTSPVAARSIRGIALGQTSIDVSSAGGVTNRVDFLEYDQSGNVIRRRHVSTIPRIAYAATPSRTRLDVACRCRSSTTVRM